MKKLIALLLCTVLFAGCSFSMGDTESEYSISSFNGVWRQTDYDPELYMEAIIDDGIITMNMMYNNGQTSVVYWYGTAPTLSESVSDYQWISDADLSKIHHDFTAISDREKHFIYKDGCLWLPYSMSDYSVIMCLERVEE